MIDAYWRQTAAVIIPVTCLSQSRCCMSLVSTNTQSEAAIAIAVAAIAIAAAAWVTPGPWAELIIISSYILVIP